MSTHQIALGSRRSGTSRSEGSAQSQDRVDFDLWFEDTALELDRLETVVRDHRFRLRYDASGVQRCLLTRGCPAGRRFVTVKAKFATGTFVFVKEIGGERYAVSDGTAEQVHNRTPD